MGETLYGKPFRVVEDMDPKSGPLGPWTFSESYHDAQRVVRELDAASPDVSVLMKCFNCIDAAETIGFIPVRYWPRVYLSVLFTYPHGAWEELKYDMAWGRHAWRLTDKDK